MALNDDLRALFGLFAIGTTLVACIIVGYFIGLWLDGLLNTAPWLMVAFVLVGSAAGFVQMVRIIKRYTK